jgi:hypothetical protein
MDYSNLRTISEAILDLARRHPDLSAPHDRCTVVRQVQWQVNDAWLVPSASHGRRLVVAEELLAQREAEYERRAPGWVVRCLKCGFTEPWGKYGFRRGAWGREWRLRRCPRCGRFCCHVIEKRKTK